MLLLSFLLAALLGLLDFIDPGELARGAGLVGIGLIIFAESGLLIGFFLPGDSLLFAAGVAAAAGIFPIAALAGICFVAAITGDAVGYWFGSRAGPALFRRPNSRWFKKDHLERARAFYDRHGGKTIVLARFIPFVRTFAPIVAGATGMQYRRFAIFNVLGGFIWGIGLPVAGYALGRQIPDIDKYLLPAIGGIILLSLLPIAVEAIRRRRKSRPAG